MAEEVTTLSDDEIEARLAGLNLEEEGDKYKFFKPTSEAFGQVMS